MPNETQITIQNYEWYENFVEEARAIIVETATNSRIEVIKGKWLLGKLVTEKENLFERAGYGDKVIETSARDIGMSASHLWKCVQFYKKFQFNEFDRVERELPEGKNISWFKLYTQYLPESTEETGRRKLQEEEQESCHHENILIRCKKCKKVFDEGEFYEIIKIRG